MLATMLLNPEGIRFLSEDRLLKQIVDCFTELDQVSSLGVCLSWILIDWSCSTRDHRVFILFWREIVWKLPSLMDILR
jgi:hypothetical protein